METLGDKRGEPKMVIGCEIGKQFKVGNDFLTILLTGEA